MNAARRAPAPRSKRVPGPERHAAILVALEKVLETTPLLKVSVKQLARSANCPMGSFYQQFDDLADAAAQLVADNRVQARLAAAAAARTMTAGDRHLAAIANLFAVEGTLPAA